MNRDISAEHMAMIIHEKSVASIEFALCWNRSGLCCAGTNPVYAVWGQKG